MCRLRMMWVCAVAALITAAVATTGGSSLRGALEALQRRQRGARRGPLGPLYSPGRPSPDEDMDVSYVDYVDAPSYQKNENLANFLLENNIEEPEEKYILEYLAEHERPYQADSDKKTAFRERLENEGRVLTRQYLKRKRSSAFRERSKPNEEDDMFINRSLDESDEEAEQMQEEKDREYYEMLNSLYKKYKSGRVPESASPYEKVIWLYNNMKNKRDDPMINRGWGPVAFKKSKRNQEQSQIDPLLLEDLKEELTERDITEADIAKLLNGREIPPYELDPYNPDMTEEIAIAFQPINNEDDAGNEYSYGPMKAKRFPVTKRSYYSTDPEESGNDYKVRMVRGGLGVNSNSKVAKDLSDIFGNIEPIAKLNIRKRSDSSENFHHDSKSPQVSALSHNHTHPDAHNDTVNHLDYNNHQHAPHAMTNIVDSESEIRKKRQYVTKVKRSFKWSDYFGIDRRKKSAPVSEDVLKTRFMDIFKTEIATPTSAIDNPIKVSKKMINFGPVKRSKNPSEDVNDFKFDRASILAVEEKRDPKRLDPVKLDNMDNKLKNLELEVVEDASKLGEHNEGLDTKEEQEMRERILSRLATAYSLQKMRKALKEFKHSLEMQKNNGKISSDIKEKKSYAQQTDLDRYFESEQGAGQFANGKTDPKFSEGYMGGSGRKEGPDEYKDMQKGNCLSLDKIVKTCKRIDVMAGDHAQLFLPLCSLHQICYLCGTRSETGCDLVFISEADSLCDNKTDCLQAARNTIMLLRELHESMADNLEGECDNNPCLRNTLQYSPNWWSRD